MAKDEKGTESTKVSMTVFNNSRDWNLRSLAVALMIRARSKITWHFCIPTSPYL